MLRSIISFLLLLTVAAPLTAADWPMFRGNADRSGYTSETLPVELSLQWTHKPAHAPVPAWPRDDRMVFDRAHHVVVAGGTAYFGGSVDGKIHALDTATGRRKWAFFTDAPVRFAPVVWKDQVYAVSDDGHLYCLAAVDGTLIRKWRGGSDDDMVLGNGQLTSRRPARGGPVIRDGILYYAAGIWQSEKVYIHALSLETGKIVWTNDDSGAIYMPQPHGGANAKSGVSAQGYLVAGADQLFVPTGRAVPAAFNRADGAFQYYHLQKNGHTGGTTTSASGSFLYNGGIAFLAKDGKLSSKLGKGVVAAFAGGIVHAGGNTLRALKVTEKTERDRRGKPKKVLSHEELWTAKGLAGGLSLAVAGETIISAGGGDVSTVNINNREQRWTGKVDGRPFGLAVADGKLFVSTDRGTIHCFAAAKQEKPALVEFSPQGKPAQANDIYVAAAEEIIKKTGVTEGYCVDFGCGDGRLAEELARRTKLEIFAVDSDPKNVAAARKRLDAAGLYGSRVTVHLRDLSQTNYPKYLANLIVSGRAVTDEAAVSGSKERSRLQRPYGGVICVGKPGAMKPDTRGALANAGSWTHQYSNAANTCCSTDAIKGPLSVLWFRDVSLEMPQRHGRGHAPLFHGGRLFVEGVDALRAVDAYNGRTLWEFAIPGVLRAHNADHLMGTAGTGSNFCIAGDSLYVHQADHCFRLNVATGEVLGKFVAPKHADGTTGKWGYIACENGVLFGSLVNETHVVRHLYLAADMSKMFSESKLLFGMDAESGKLLWRYDAAESVRHNAIAIGDGRVFLIDRRIAKDDRLDRAAKRRGGKKPKFKPEPHLTGSLVILDARTGETKVKNDKDIFGTVLAFSDEHDMLLMTYQPTVFRLPSELGGRMAVFRASEGYRVWDKKMKYVTRPLVNGRTIYAQGGAWDLLTGDSRPFEFKRSYGCGQVAGGKNLLLFRSATLGYLDLSQAGKPGTGTSKTGATRNFGGIRPGCWINALPVGGLVLLPDASAGCRCSYQNRSWVAFQGSD